LRPGAGSGDRRGREYRDDNSRRSVHFAGTVRSEDGVQGQFGQGHRKHQEPTRSQARPRSDPTDRGCAEPSRYGGPKEAKGKYLRQQESEADLLQRQLESDPRHQKTMTELRERILARSNVQHKKVNQTPIRTILYQADR